MLIDLTAGYCMYSILKFNTKTAKYSSISAKLKAAKYCIYWTMATEAGEVMVQQIFEILNKISFRFYYFKCM